MTNVSCLQRVPRVNAIWANEGPQLSQTVDISVAVATPNGLITPIIRGATYLTVDQISKTVKVSVSTSLMHPELTQAPHLLRLIAVFDYYTGR